MQPHHALRARACLLLPQLPVHAALGHPIRAAEQGGAGVPSAHGPRCCNCPLCLLFNAAWKMSGKASCALETVWEDKQKYGEAERRFYEHKAMRAAAQQLPAEALAVNGPGREDEAEEAGAPNGNGSSEPGKSHNGKKPLQKPRKRSPRGWLSQGDLALVGLSADHVWLDKPLFDQAESSYTTRGWQMRPPRQPGLPPWPLGPPAPSEARWPATT